MAINKNLLEKKIKFIINDFETKNFKKVIDKSKKILIKNPNIDYLINIIGLSYLELKNLEKAGYYFLETIKKNPSNIAAKNNYGMVLKSLDKIDEAEKIFEKIIHDYPHHIPSLNNLANIRRENGNFESAIAFYKRILAIDKNNIIARYNLSISLSNIRKKDEALKEALIINDHDPKFTQTDEIISSLTNYKNDKKKHLEKMLDKLEKLDLNYQQKIPLFFSLGKAYEDKEDYNNAFKYYELANKTARDLIEYDITIEEKKFTKIKKLFLEKKNISLKFSANNQKKIIFICGMPRSGSTLLEQIISSHKHVVNLGETNFLNIIINQFNETKKHDFLPIISKTYNDQINYIYDAYLRQINRLNLNKNIFTDKSLLNFQYIGFIKIFFPNSKILILNRDFKNNFLSIFKNSLPVLKWSYSIKEIVNFYNLFKKYQDFWEEQFPGEILIIDYHKLVTNTEQTIKKTLNYCGLEWDSNCLEYYKTNNSPIKTASVNQADKPIYKDSIDLYVHFHKFFNL